MSEKLLQNLKALRNTVQRIAIKAGRLILNHYDEAGSSQAWLKADGSPVTAADQEAEALIENELTAVLPNVPFIGEEAVCQGHMPDVSETEYFWLVDPLDGTKQFIAGTDEFTVNIALIRHNIPIVGVVYAPVKGALYSGYVQSDHDKEAMKWLEETGKEKIIHSRKPPPEGLKVITGVIPKPGGRMDKFLNGFKVAKLIRAASSLKICLIAAGKADLYPRLGKTCEWDTAAGQAILTAAGGTITDLQGRILRYKGRGPDYENPDFVAAGFDWVEAT